VKILEKWLALKAAIPPTRSLEQIEEARRLFYAGATAAFELLIKETNGQSIEEQVSVIHATEKELLQHRNELAEGYRRKLN
jgi:cellobiose-specific phosphotransferase system component IIA